jgi:hypothetical protein
MDDLAPQCLYTPYRGGKVRDRKIREGETIARPDSTPVQPERDPVVCALPALALSGSALSEGDL